MLAPWSVSAFDVILCPGFALIFEQCAIVYLALVAVQALHPPVLSDPSHSKYHLPCAWVPFCVRGCNSVLGAVLPQVDSLVTAQHGLGLFNPV